MTSQNLAHTFEGFLSGSNNAVVIEDGAVVFDLGQAKYSVSGESNKMFAAHLVGGAERCPESPGGGEQRRKVAGDGAAGGAGASDEA